MKIRRAMTVLGTTVVAMSLASSAAFAHECFNASRSDTGNANAENGQALSSIDELVNEELCPEGALIVSEWLESNQEEFDPDGILVQVNALMGGGAHHNGNKTTDGHDIDYLPEELTDAIGAAFRTCFPPPPAA